MNQNILKKRFFDSQKIILCVFGFLIISICFLRSIVYVADFIPVNGTFQNYNPIRRVLDGQTPYVDFSLYLGLGHLCFGTFFTWLFGGNYTNSLVAFQFLTYLFTSMFVFVLGYYILQSIKKSVIVTSLFTVIFSVIQKFELFNSINNLLSVGVSARIIRGFAPVWCVMVLSIAYNRINKSKIFKKNYTIQKNQIGIIGFSFVAGMAFVYSNDYGISTCICFFVLLCTIVFSRKMKLWKKLFFLLEYSLICSISIILIVFFITKGNIVSWFSQTFGIGSFQTYYFLSGKSYYIYNLDFSFSTIIQFLISIVYLILLLKHHGSFYSIKRFGVPALLNLTAFCAANEYKLLSGGYLHEVSQIILFFTVFFEILGCVIKNIEALKKANFHIKIIATIFTIMICTAWCGYLSYQKVLSYQKTNEDSNAKYIDSLGGYFYTKSNDLTEAYDFLDGESVWSTYASAIECMTSQFQPSGYDYIIHVLGEEARKKYINSFNESDFKYVATITPNVTDYYNWIYSANWFFTKELLKEWHPAFSNGYEMFWERNNDNENFVVSSKNIAVKSKRISESQYKIMLISTTDINGVADVNISYKSEKSQSWKSKTIWFYHIKVKETNPIYEGQLEGFNLPNNGENISIPVNVINGYGEIIVTSAPEENTKLEITDINCNNIYTVEHNYLHVLSTQQLPENIENYCVIEIENNDILKTTGISINSIEVNNKIIEIVDSSYSIDKNSCYLTAMCSESEIKKHLGKHSYLRLYKK